MIPRSKGFPSEVSSWNLPKKFLEDSLRTRESDLSKDASVTSTWRSGEVKIINMNYSRNHTFVTPRFPKELPNLTSSVSRKLFFYKPPYIMVSLLCVHPFDWEVLCSLLVDIMISQSSRVNESRNDFIMNTSTKSMAIMRVWAPEWTNSHDSIDYRIFIDVMRSKMKNIGKFLW